MSSYLKHFPGPRLRCKNLLFARSAIQTSARFGQNGHLGKVVQKHAEEELEVGHDLVHMELLETMAVKETRPQQNHAMKTNVQVKHFTSCSTCDGLETRAG